jgi:hypothetical protein
VNVALLLIGLNLEKKVVKNVFLNV